MSRRGATSFLISKSNPCSSSRTSWLARFGANAFLGSLVILPWLWAWCATAQQHPPPSQQKSSESMEMGPATVVVNVRELNGTPLDAPALVKLFSNSMTFNEISATRDNATATFQNVRPGEYRVEVTAPGYKT